MSPISSSPRDQCQAQRWLKGERDGLAVHTCVLMSHGVSDDATEDDPAGHSDGDSAGAVHTDSKHGEETGTVSKGQRAGWEQDCVGGREGLSVNNSLPLAAGSVHCGGPGGAKGGQLETQNQVLRGGN